MALIKKLAGSLVTKAKPASVLINKINATHEKNENEPSPIKKNINTNFDDPAIAFKSKTTPEIIRSYFLYELLSINWIVDNNIKIMKIANRILGDNIFVIFMKGTFFGHFVGGEDEKSVTPLIKKMSSYGVGSILDYSVEEDISTQIAESLEKKALDDPKTELPQYQVHKVHLDRRDKVVSARTYFYINEEVCDKNLDRFLKSVETVSKITPGNGIVAIKLTALCRPKLLLQLSEVIAKCRIFMSNIFKSEGGLPIIHTDISKENFKKRVSELMKNENEKEKFLQWIVADDKGMIHLFPWSGILNDEFEVNETFKVPDPKTGEMVRLMSHLTKEEETHFKSMVRRLNTLMRTAEELNAKVMIDAEQSYFQPAISRLTVELMRKYNTKDGIVYNTYQKYLKSSYNEVLSDLEQARRQKFYFRCKLVRGAYMDQERERAKEMKYEDPIQPNYNATSENYAKTLTECIRQIKKLKDEGVKEKRIAVMVASHNEDTVRLAIEKMREMEIAPEEKTIMFGQLLGMCDFVSFTLADAGYSVYKYTPYGPVKEVLPYLSRRAIENKGVLKNVKKEKSMLRKEILRRSMIGLGIQKS